MIITRNGVEITLTKEELHKAFREYFAGDIRNCIEENIETIYEDYADDTNYNFVNTLEEVLEDKAFMEDLQDTIESRIFDEIDRVFDEFEYFDFLIDNGNIEEL